jgi:ABC-type glutathione transport system ATPase component
VTIAAVTDLRVVIAGDVVLSGLDLTVAPGERVGLLGASGSGKSMTARTLLGQLPAGARATGSVRIGGREVLGTPAARRPRSARAAHVSQDSATALNPLVRLDRQLCHPMIVRGADRDAARSQAAALLEAVGLPSPTDLLRRFPGQLSGGQRQRVCIALALACQSPLLVADEPTTALDVVSQRQVIDTLLTYTSGQGRPGEPAPGLLFITHDLAVASQVCERALVLVDGTVVESKPMLDLLLEPEHPYTRSLVAVARATQLPDLGSTEPTARPVGATAR